MPDIGRLAARLARGGDLADAGVEGANEELRDGELGPLEGHRPNKPFVGGGALRTTRSAPGRPAGGGSSASLILLRTTPEMREDFIPPDRRVGVTLNRGVRRKEPAVSDEREMLGGEEGQLIDGGPQRGELEEKDEGEDFEGHQLETGMLDDGSGVIEVDRAEDL